MTKVQNTNVSAVTKVENKKVKKQQQKKEQQVFKGNGNKQTVQKPNDSALKQEIYKKTGFQLKDTKNRGQKIPLKVNGRDRWYETVGTLTTGGRILVKEIGKEVYHVVSHTPDKKPVMLKDDYARNKVFYETTSAEHKVKIGKKNYIITNSKRDRHGRMTAINSRGQEVILSHDGKELKHSYVEAEDQKDNLNDYIAQQTKGKSKAEANKIRQQIMDGNSSYSSKGVLRFKASNGEVWYYDTKRKTYVKYAEKEAQAIIKDLDKGAKEDWWLFRTGLGTDYELLKNTNAQIIDPEVLNKINKHYSTEYGKKVDKNAEYGSGKYKTAYEAFLASEIGDDEVYLFNATLVKNKAITDQSRRNEILQTNLTKISGIGIEGLGVGVNKRANRMAAADAASTKEDYQTLQDAAEDENIKNNYKPQFKGQDALQTYIYGVHDGDVQEIDDFNNALIDPKENMLDRDEIVRIKAETGVLWLKEGNFKKGFEAQDNDVTKQMFALQNPNGKAVLNANTLKQQAAKDKQEDYMMMARPDLYSDKELASRATQLLKDALLDLNNYHSVEFQMPTYSATGGYDTNAQAKVNFIKDAEENISRAYSMIRNDKILAMVKKEMGNNYNLLIQREQEHLKTNNLKNITTITDIQVTKYTDNKGEVKLTPEQIAHNKYVVTWLKSQLLDIERDKKSNEAKEGWKQGFVNNTRDLLFGGVTRASLADKYNLIKSNMARLEAAAEGKLVDASGKPVSFEDAMKNLGEAGIQALEQANAEYQTAQQIGEFMVDMVALAIPIPGLSAGNIVRLSGTLYKIVGTTGKMYKAIKVTEEAVKGQKIINYVVKEAKTLKKATSSAIKTVKEAEKAEKGIKIAKFAEKYPKLNKVLKLTDASATGAMHMELKTAVLEGTNIATSREGFTSDRISEMNEKVKSAGKFGGMGGAIGGTTGMLAEYVSSTGAKYVVHGLGLVADMTGAAGLMTAESHGETNFWDNLLCVNPDGSFNFEQATMTAMMIYGHLHGASTVRGKSKAQVFDEITTNNDLQLRYQKGNEGSYEYFNAEALKWEPTTKEFFNERVARDGVKREAHSVKLENRELRLDNDGIWSDAESGRKFRLAKDNNGRTQLAELTKKEIYNSRQKTEVKDGMTLEDFRQELKNNDLRGNVYTKADGGRLVVVKHSFNKYELYEFDTNNKMISQKSVKGKSAIKESYPEFANVESSGTIGSTSGYLGMNNPVGKDNKPKKVEALQDTIDKKELTALRNELGIYQSKPGHSFVGKTDGANTVINEMKNNDIVNSYIVSRDTKGKAYIAEKVSYKNGKAIDKIEYVHDENGNVIKEIHKGDNLTREILKDAEGNVLEIVENVYDSQGNLQKTIHKDAQGNIKSEFDPNKPQETSKSENNAQVTESNKPTGTDPASHSEAIAEESQVTKTSTANDKNPVIASEGEAIQTKQKPLSTEVPKATPEQVAQVMNSLTVFSSDQGARLAFVGKYSTECANIAKKELIYTVDEGKSVKYFPDKDISLIDESAITKEDTGRIGTFRIAVKGRVSEADAKALMEHLFDKGVIKRDADGRLLTKSVLINGNNEKLGEAISEFLANKKLNSQNPIGHSERVSGIEQQVKHTVVEESRVTSKSPTEKSVTEKPATENPVIASEGEEIKSPFEITADKFVVNGNEQPIPTFEEAQRTLKKYGGNQYSIETGDGNRLIFRYDDNGKFIGSREEISINGKALKDTSRNADGTIDKTIDYFHTNDGEPVLIERDSNSKPTKIKWYKRNITFDKEGKASYEVTNEKNEIINKRIEEAFNDYPELKPLLEKQGIKLVEESNSPVPPVVENKGEGTPASENNGKGELKTPAQEIVQNVEKLQTLVQNKDGKALLEEAKKDPNFGKTAEERVPSDKIVKDSDGNIQSIEIDGVTYTRNEQGKYVNGNSTAEVFVNTDSYYANSNSNKVVVINQNKITTIKSKDGVGINYDTTTGRPEKVMHSSQSIDLKTGVYNRFGTEFDIAGRVTKQKLCISIKNRSYYPNKVEGKRYLDSNYASNGKWLNPNLNKETKTNLSKQIEDAQLKTKKAYDDVRNQIEDAYNNNTINRETADNLHAKLNEKAKANGLETQETPTMVAEREALAEWNKQADTIKGNLKSEIEKVDSQTTHDQMVEKINEACEYDKIDMNRADELYDALKAKAESLGNVESLTKKAERINNDLKAETENHADEVAETPAPENNGEGSTLQKTPATAIEDKYPNVPKFEEVETNEGLQLRHKVGDENSYEFFEPEALKWEPTTKEFFEKMTSRDGVKSKATYQNIKNADGSTVQRFIDANGKKVKQINRNKDGKITGSDEYVYDVDGKRSKKISKNKDGKVSISTEYKYNEFEKESERIIKDGKGNVIYSEEYKYDKSGNQIEFIHKDENGKIINSTEYKYNEFGKKSEIIHKDKDGNLVDSTVFEYDANGKMSLEYKKDSKGEIVSSEEYKYNADDKLSKTITRDKDGNITIIYDDEHGRLLSPEETNNYIKKSLENDINNINTQENAREYIAELGEALEKKIITDEEYNALVGKAGEKLKAEEAAKNHADEVAEANNGEEQSVTIEPVTPEPEKTPDGFPKTPSKPEPKPKMLEEIFGDEQAPKTAEEAKKYAEEHEEAEFVVNKDSSKCNKLFLDKKHNNIVFYNQDGTINSYREFSPSKGVRQRDTKLDSDGTVKSVKTCATNGDLKVEYYEKGNLQEKQLYSNENNVWTDHVIIFDSEGNMTKARKNVQNKEKNSWETTAEYEYNADNNVFELKKEGKVVSTVKYDEATEHWAEFDAEGKLVYEINKFGRRKGSFRARISKATKNIIDKFRSNKPKNKDGTTIPKKFRGRDDVTYNSNLKEYTETISKDGHVNQRVYDSKGTLLRESIDKEKTVFYNEDGVDIAVNEVISDGFQRTEFSKDYDLEIQRDLNGNYKKATIKYHNGHEPKENGTKIATKEYSYEDGKFVSKKDGEVVETLEYDADKHSWTIKDAKGKKLDSQNNMKKSHKVGNFVAGTTLAGAGIALIGHGIYELSNKDDEDKVGTIAEDGTLILDGKSYPENADGTYTIDGKKYKVEDGKLVEVVDTPDDNGKTTKVTLDGKEGTIAEDGTLTLDGKPYPKDTDGTYTIGDKKYKVEDGKLVEVVDTPDDNGETGGAAPDESPEVKGTIDDKEYTIKDGKVSVDGAELTPDENGHYKIGDDKYKIEDGKLVKVEPEEPAKTDAGTDAAQSDDSQTGGGRTGGSASGITGSQGDGRTGGSTSGTTGSQGGGRTGSSTSGTTGSQIGGRTGGSTSGTTGSQIGGRTDGSTSRTTGTTHNDTSRPVTTRHSAQSGESRANSVRHSERSEESRANSARHSAQSEESRANSVRHSERSEESRLTGNTPVTGVTEPTEAQKQVANALQNEISGISTQADVKAFFAKLDSAVKTGQITIKQCDELMHQVETHVETLLEVIKTQNEQDAIPEPEFGLGEVPTQQQPQRKEKREITPMERMDLTEKIRRATDRNDIEKIQQEMRQYKVFPGRKNLRRAYKAKLRAIKHQDEPNVQKYNEKFNKRMEKVSDDNIKVNNAEFMKQVSIDENLRKYRDFEA